MERKIFNNQGFLSTEGKTFVDDGFTKELKRVLATAQTPNDVLVISGILKSIVGNYATHTYRSVKEASIKDQVGSFTKEQIEMATKEVYVVRPGDYR
jgi:hypothetical protein